MKSMLKEFFFEYKTVEGENAKLEDEGGESVDVGKKKLKIVLGSARWFQFFFLICQNI